MNKLFIDVTDKAIDVPTQMAHLSADCVGAIALFLGTVRDSHGDLTALHLEHYEGMTQKQIATIAETALDKWQIEGLRIIHRIGRLLPQESIVLVAAASAHRGDALDCVHYVMDYLKTDAPFWKAEEKDGKLSWVEARASDDHAKAKWPR